MHFRWFFPPLHFSYSPKFQIQKDVLLASFCTCSAIRDYRWMSEIFNQIIHLWLMLPSCWCCPWLLCLTIRLFISLNQTNNLFLISQWTIFLYKIWSLFDLLTSNTQAALFFCWYEWLWTQTWQYLILLYGNGLCLNESSKNNIWYIRKVNFPVQSKMLVSSVFSWNKL